MLLVFLPFVLREIGFQDVSVSLLRLLVKGLVTYV